MSKRQEERELSTFDRSDTERLLRFNVTKQRIVDLANQEFEDDWFDEAKDYSSWNRALNGRPVWIGLVDRLEAVMADQIAHPRKYLPADDPPDAEHLVPWMKQIAGAPWWRDVLKLSASVSAFNAWYSGRPMGKDKVAEVKAKVDEWWARVKAACERAELRSQGEKFNLKIVRALNDGPPDYDPDNIASHFYHLVVELGMPVEEARLLYQDLIDLGANYGANLIDLTDPKDPLWLWGDSSNVRDHYGREFDQMVADGFPQAVPKFQPPFDPYEVVEEKRWGDRRDEDSPKDLNEELYGRFYRRRIRHFWDPATQRGDCEPEITETSEDGVTWRPATEREGQGWNRGTYFFLEALNQGVYPVENSYTRDCAELSRRFRDERDRLDKAIRDADSEDALDRAQGALQAAERRFEEAKFRLRLHDLD